MFFKQFYDKHLSQASYLIGCQKTGEAMIIDPIRDLSSYIRVADEEGLTITHAAETHIHANFVSGIRDVAIKLNASIYVSGESDDTLGYKNMPNHTHFVQHNDDIYVGNIKLKVLHTPGHTPESISFLLTDEGAGAQVPMGLFSGDFIFVGDIGRPDLLEKAVKVEGLSEIGAKQMFKSIESIKDLPNYIQIWPGHGAGSPCGKSLGAIPTSTLGYEKQTNWAFSENNEATFIDKLISDQPAPPHHFAQMKKINQFGMNLYQPYTVYPATNTNRLTFDLRSKEAYHGGHIEGTINIPYDKNFINQIGWYLNYDQEINLIGEYHLVSKATHTLQLIGYDDVAGYQLPQSKIQTRSIHSEDITGNESHILDVRNDNEWNNGHLSQAVHVPHGKLLETDLPFNRNDVIYVHCQSGIRSSIAIGILEHKGYHNIINVNEGYKDIHLS